MTTNHLYCTTNQIDSTVKSCINCHDPHILFSGEPYVKVLGKSKINFLVFPALINFLPHELSDFRCNNCGFTAFYRNGYTPKHLIRIPATNCSFQTAIYARSARLRCRNCNASCSAKSDIVDYRCQISNLLKTKISAKLANDISAKTVAFEEGVSPSYVNRLLDTTRCVFRINFNFLPLHLCFDEFRGTHNTYHFIYIDADTHVIQDILPNRLKQTIFDYFMRFPSSVRGLVRTVTCDLNSYYVGLIKALFPNAKIIIDRFHIVQMLNRAVNSMRTDLMNSLKYGSQDYRLLKQNWKLFLKQYDDLDCTHQFFSRSQRKWVTSEQLVNAGLELADDAFRKAYWDYQHLLSVINNPTPSKLEAFKRRVIETHQSYTNSDRQATKSDKVLLTFYDNLQGITQALSLEYRHYTNGPLEGINRKIKQIQRTTYGYRNFKHLKARVYLQTCLGKNTKSSMKTA